MDKSVIESAVCDVLKGIWRNQDVLWAYRSPSPFEMLDPEAAARILGVAYETHEQLGAFGNASGRFEVAGLIDRAANRICISRQFSFVVRRFTAAHEIGHWILHPGETQHRDRPIKELGLHSDSRPAIEREADYFAACFLMPPNLLMDAFKARFGGNIPLVIDDNAAFFLCREDPGLLLLADPDSLDRELAAAASTSYQGRFFPSLREQFQVSVTAMAIRLKELGLLRA